MLLSHFFSILTSFPERKKGCGEMVCGLGGGGMVGGGGGGCWVERDGSGAWENVTKTGNRS